MPAGFVGLSVAASELSRIRSQIVLELIEFLVSGLGSVTMTLRIKGNVVFDRNTIGVVDEHTALVGIYDYVLGDHRFGGSRLVKVNGVTSFFKTSHLHPLLRWVVLDYFHSFRFIQGVQTYC